MIFDPSMPLNPTHGAFKWCVLECGKIFYCLPDTVPSRILTEQRHSTVTHCRPNEINKPVPRSSMWHTQNLDLTPNGQFGIIISQSSCVHCGGRCLDTSEAEAVRPDRHH